MEQGGRLTEGGALLDAAGFSGVRLDAWNRGLVSYFLVRYDALSNGPSRCVHTRFPGASESSVKRSGEDVVILDPDTLSSPHGDRDFCYFFFQFCQLWIWEVR